jgi:hypothetical protein
LVREERSYQELSQTFTGLRLDKYPDKTLIERVGKGFDLLGHHFSPDWLSVAEETIEKCLARAVRLYEHEREEPFGSPRLGKCGQRWIRWLSNGITLCATEANLVHPVVGTKQTTHCR